MCKSRRQNFLVVETAHAHVFYLHFRSNQVGLRAELLGFIVAIVIIYVICILRRSFAMLQVQRG